MRLVVTGGRKYTDAAHVNWALSAIHRKHGITLLIEGGATGADQLCKTWAEENGVRVASYPAHWRDIRRRGAVIRKRKDGTLYDAAAGSVRNQQMIDEGMPDAAVAFPGNNGTSDMVDRIKRANVRLWDLR